MRILAFGLLATVTVSVPGFAQENEESLHPPVMDVVMSKDFKVTGDGSSKEWERAEWFRLNARTTVRADRTRGKVMYSPTGMYFLLEGKDKALTATFEEDFANLWTEDVFEVFLWPDESLPIYLEYEISPLGYELPILVPNRQGKYYGWLPWHYEKERKIQKETTVSGGKKESGSKIDAWTAEFFIPYALLAPLGNVPPRPGTIWRANFYRMDYDGGKAASWDWARVGASFHEHKKYGTLRFK